MSVTRAATIGRVARWVLLSCTLFGLAVMHTLGHAGMRMDGHDHAGAAVRAAATMINAGAGHDSARMFAVVPQDCAGGHCGGHAMTDWSVCLAILSGLALIVLLAALLWWAGSARHRTRKKPAGVLAAPRGPPRRPVGLITASIAVLRI